MLQQVLRFARRTSTQNGIACSQWIRNLVVQARNDISFEPWLNGKPFRILQLPSIGRGLFATSPISQGTIVHVEQPLACTPAPENLSKVCYSCLKVLDAGLAASAAEGDDTLHRFCGSQCQEQAEHTFLPVESHCDVQPIWDSCQQTKERFPLLAARLAFLRIAADLATTTTGSTALRASAPLPFLDLTHLCHVNIPDPPPQPWAEQYQLLHTALQPLRQARNPQVAAAANTITLGWYASVLSRLHVNSFKVDAILPFDWQDMHAVAAAMVAQTSDAYSGSAVYVVASLFNHSCEPNLDVAYRSNSATATFTAARDIKQGEQLCISYIDADMAFEARQRTLSWSYGFQCKCEKCREQQCSTGRGEAS